MAYLISETTSSLISSEVTIMLMPFFCLTDILMADSQNLIMSNIFFAFLVLREGGQSIWNNVSQKLRIFSFDSSFSFIFQPLFRLSMIFSICFRMVSLIILRQLLLYDRSSMFSLSSSSLSLLLLLLIYFCMYSSNSFSASVKTYHFCEY